MNKAHGHDDIFVRMIKTCDSMVTEPQFFLKKLYWMLNHGCRIFPDTWKKLHIVPVHKNNDKHLLNNYHPISALPICGKILKDVFNSVFIFLTYIKTVWFLT